MLQARDETARARTGVRVAQPIDAAGLSSGVSLGIPDKSQSPAALSARMYKICTPVSTGFVDNDVRASRGVLRKALSGARFGAAGAAAPATRGAGPCGAG